MTSDGTPWRPLVHGLDIAKAIRRVLAAPARGRARRGLQRRLATSRTTGCARSPRSSADVFRLRGELRRHRRRQPQLPGLLRQDRQQAARLRVRVGRRQRRPAAARRVLARIDLDDATFTGRGHTRLKQLQHLIATGQLDDELFWRRRMIINRTPIEGVAVVDLELRAGRPRLLRPHLRRRRVRRRRPRADRRAVQRVVQPQGRHAARHALPGRPAPEAKLVRCIRGRDRRRHRRHAPGVARPACSTWPVELTADNRRALYVPPYFAHGYQTLVDDTEVIYQVERLLRAGRRARPALRRPGPGHRLAAADHARSAPRTRPGRCWPSESRPSFGPRARAEVTA